ncbi:hypothetical protein [Acidovorax temperans]
MSTFTHTPRPAITTDTPNCEWQRRFGNAAETLGYNLTASTDKKAPATIVVFRDATTNVASLRLNLGLWTKASMAVRLTPAEMRELATRLVDAAHDIETNPAAKLKKALAAKQAAA